MKMTNIQWLKKYILCMGVAYFLFGFIGLVLKQKTWQPCGKANN